MSDREFVQGMYGKKPHENAPDFKVASISVKWADFVAWQKEGRAKNPDKEWLNLEMTTQKKDANKFSFSVDTWKPKEAAPEPEPAASGGGGMNDDIPFAPVPSVP